MKFGKIIGSATLLVCTTAIEITNQEERKQNLRDIDANLDQHTDRQGETIRMDGDLQLSSSGFNYILREAYRRTPGFDRTDEHGDFLSIALVYCRENPDNNFC